jgi:hypothetical protein
MFDGLRLPSRTPEPGVVPVEPDRPSPSRDHQPARATSELRQRSSAMRERARTASA